MNGYSFYLDYYNAAKRVLYECNKVVCKIAVKYVSERNSDNAGQCG